MEDNRHTIKRVETIDLKKLLDPTNASYTSNFFDIIDVFDHEEK